MENRSIAIVIALLFGGVGGHMFYVGRPVSGIIRFLFSWTFIPTIIAIVDIFKYLGMSDRQFKKHVRLNSK